MSIKLRTIILAAVGLLAVACGGTKPPPSRLDADMSRAPLIRVGLLQHRDRIKFMINGAFSIYTADGKFVARGLEGNTWEATIARIRAAEAEYRLKFASTGTYDDAVENARFLARRNLRFEIIQEPSIASRTGINELNSPAATRYHIVLWQIFRTQEAAEDKRRALAAKVPLEVFIVNKTAGRGEIELKCRETGKSLSIPDHSQLATERFAILDVPVGEGFHWERRESRVYRGILEFLIDTQQKLTAVNVIPVESYLRGVVPAEMPESFPEAALQAQAIAARSGVLHKLGRGPHEEFDICATVHCQVYGGINSESERTNAAVVATTGLVLESRNNILDAAFTGVCGGQTENNENIWDGDPQPALRGIFDGDGAPDVLDEHLKQEEIVRRWIEKRAPVYCNTVDTAYPSYLEYTRKYFRWSVRETRQDLEKYIVAETGTQFGSLLNIVPVERGVSGRLRRVRIIGTLKSFEIAKDLNIRRALSPSTLFSSCLVVERVPGPSGLPAAFVFHGAGWGHGVGMCQTGAAVMALQGFSFEEILRHFYTGVRIERAY